MAKRGYVPTTQELEELYNKAEAGDEGAAAELGRLNNKMAKRANERMRELERRDYDGTAAYQRAKYWLGEEGRDYFSQSKVVTDGGKIDSKKLDSIYENLEKASEYLRWQTSTTAGEVKRRENITNSLFDGYYDSRDKWHEGVLSGVHDNPEYDKQDFLEFLNTDTWNDIRKLNKGGTDVIIREAFDSLQKGAKVGDLKRAFRDFQMRKTNTDFIEVWDNWTSGKSYYNQGSWKELKKPRF